MPLHHNVSATWKDSTLWHNVAGTWKKVALYHNVSGVWKAITSLLGASLPSTVGCITMTTTGPSITLSNAGTWSTVGGGGSGTWMTGGANSDYEARASNLAGNTANATGTYNSWLPLSTSRTWGITAGGIGTVRWITFTLEIRMAASPNTVFTTSAITLDSDRS